MELPYKNKRKINNNNKRRDVSNIYLLKSLNISQEHAEFCYINENTFFLFNGLYFVKYYSG